MELIILDDITLVSTDVAGSTYAEYASGTTYALGDKKKVSFESNGTTPRFPVVEYESLAGGNTGNYPPDSPAQWTEIGAQNAHKMFDDYTNTQTFASADINVVLDADGFSEVGLFGLYGTEVTLALKKGGATIKTETFDLRTFIPESGWYAWLFYPYELGTDKLRWSFPKYASGATLEIEITLRSSQAACGMVVMGNARDLGITRYGVKVGIDDYSIKDTDSLGRTYLAQGNYADRADIEMWLTNTNIDYVSQSLRQVRGVPAMFDLNNSGGTAFQSMILYGYTQNFDIIIPGPVRSKCNLEVRGLV
jgi:hypothetical protein